MLIVVCLFINCVIKTQSRNILEFMRLGMDYIGNVPKAQLINHQAERLANSKGEKQPRIELIADPHHRYAIVYQKISKEHQHDPDYKLSNPIKKRYWVPLKIQVDGEKEPRWVLVNKASLHKRFGLSYKEIDDGVKEGTLNSVVDRRVDNIKNHERTQPGGKFVNAAAEKLENSEGGVKDRYKFVSHDPDNSYAVHYKGIDQPEKGDSPALNAIQRRFWVPYNVNNGDGSYTWILLNKSSLRKRLEITEEELEGFIEKGNLSEELDKKVYAIEWNYNAAVEQKKDYVDISNEILKATNAYASRVEEKFTAFCKLKKPRSAEDKRKFGKELDLLRQEFVGEWKKIETHLTALDNLESDRFRKIRLLVDESLGEITNKLNKLIKGIHINEFPGIKMGKISKDFKKLANDLDAPIQKLEREQYEGLSKEIIGSVKSFRGYLQNRFVFFKYEPGVTHYTEGINEEFEKLKENVKGPLSKIEDLKANRFRNAINEALGKDGAVGRIGLPLKDLLGNLQEPDSSYKMDAILKICDDIIAELDTSKN